MPEFNKNFIRQVEKHVKQLVLDRMAKTALHVINRIVLINPLDTGQSRAAWNLGLNVIDLNHPDKPPSRHEKFRGQAIFPPPVFRVKKANKYTDRYYLVNAVKHTQYLNEGTDTLPALKFIEREISIGIKEIEGGLV